MKILTFDIEEWFHILDNESTKTETHWLGYESRIQENIDRIFSILATSNSKATFFVVGWIAQQYPSIVRQITDLGFEIGSHTHMHQLVYDQDEESFRQDVDRSIKTLEDISGKKVCMFRAPGFSITEKNKWAFEVLFDLGITIDSSVFPMGRAHGGMASYGVAKPSILEYNGVRLKEFPINTHSVLAKSFIYSGGGYFRILPYSILKKWTEDDDYVMSYIHPRDLDPGQPVIKELRPFRKFKSYVGLKTAEYKLKKWLKDFHFIDIEMADQEIDWSLVQKVKL
jgi:polysaccharide deacetylase family protein (PEP-CTERM system associated)